MSQQPDTRLIVAYGRPVDEENHVGRTLQPIVWTMEVGLGAEALLQFLHKSFNEVTVAEAQAFFSRRGYEVEAGSAKHALRQVLRLLADHRLDETQDTEDLHEPSPPRVLGFDINGARIPWTAGLVRAARDLSTRHGQLGQSVSEGTAHNFFRARGHETTSGTYASALFMSLLTGDPVHPELNVEGVTTMRWPAANPPMTPLPTREPESPAAISIPFATLPVSFGRIRQDRVNEYPPGTVVPHLRDRTLSIPYSRTLALDAVQTLRVLGNDMTEVDDHLARTVFLRNGIIVPMESAKDAFQRLIVMARTTQPGTVLPTPTAEQHAMLQARDDWKEIRWACERAQKAVPLFETLLKHRTSAMQKSLYMAAAAFSGQMTVYPMLAQLAEPEAGRIEGLGPAQIFGLLREACRLCSIELQQELDAIYAALQNYYKGTPKEFFFPGDGVVRVDVPWTSPPGEIYRRIKREE